MRVFLDTNLLVAALATRGLCADVLRAVLARHELVLSQVVLAELERALLDKIGLPGERVLAAVSFFTDFVQAARPEPAGEERLRLRDPGDAIVLGALAAGAEVLVTGDRDLLEAPALPILVVSPRDFWATLRAPANTGAGEVHEG